MPHPEKNPVKPHEAGAGSGTVLARPSVATSCTAAAYIPGGRAGTSVARSGMANPFGQRDLARFSPIRWPDLPGVRHIIFSSGWFHKSRSSLGLLAVTSSILLA